MLYSSLDPIRSKGYIGERTFKPTDILFITLQINPYK